MAKRPKTTTNGKALPALASIRSYAAARDVASSTLRHHIATGLIKLVDGKIDVAQADAGWGRHRRGRYLTHTGAGRNTAHQGANARGAKAKLRRLRARLALARDKLASEWDRYCRRDEAVAQVTAEGRFTLERLAALPDEQDGALAERLGVSREVAHAILAKFMATCLSEIGDLPGQLARIARRG